jgi:uncharacterized membrane protein HdeD (DUF308 family)
MPQSLSARVLRGRSIPFFLITMLYAGAVSLAAFDFFGQALSPMLGYAALAPVGLANQVLQIITGESIRGGGHLLHYLAGVVAYPLGWMLVVEPLRRTLMPSLHWSIAAIFYGVALWVFALYIMAHLIAGNPAFLGFSGITWVALIGHVLFAVVTAVVYRARYGD